MARCLGAASVLVFIPPVFSSPPVPKRGVAWPGHVPYTCDDAAALGLQHSWHYNWNHLPDPHGACIGSGRVSLGAEYVPMCWGAQSCTKDRLGTNYSEIWRSAGAQYLLGFNEPDGRKQSNIAPAKAAQLWPEVQAVAATAGLRLVSPAVAVFHAGTGSTWLDEFFANCSSGCQGLCMDCDPSAIEFVGIHDYGGNATKLIEVVRTVVGRCTSTACTNLVLVYSVNNLLCRPPQSVDY